MWLWLSMIPGTTVRAAQVDDLRVGPVMRPSRVPTSAKRPSVIDTEETIVFSSSIVCILPLMSTVSGASFGGRGRVFPRRALLRVRRCSASSRSPQRRLPRPG